MSDGFSLKIDTKELDRKLGQLPIKARRVAIRKALKAGGEVIAASMIALAPERTDEPTPESDSLPPGILKADIQVQVVARSNQPPRVKIGPGEISAHVGNWMENGFDLTTGGRKGKGGKFVRHIEGKHFMASAFDEAAEAAIDMMLETLGEALATDTDESGGEDTTE